MFRIFLVFLLMNSAGSAWSFSCPPQTLKQRYESAHRVFLIYITETELDEDLLQRFTDISSNFDEEDKAVKLISANYRIIEEFKGPVDYKPKLLDLLGIGTGFVGLHPGVYYLAMLPTPDSDIQDDVAFVNICNTPLKHYRLQVQYFQETLDELRSYQDR